uniref:Alpha-N-acetylgalactosamine-specific lectin-like n=1 Tax=Saccoglossus kowalevskii TaxID=10224 RepID=A0ABM0N0S4_SACKO|nr:PREDICTED: alpha-N-acetylgalactosamine-specific lectin-like [Saccoglossus kowalevskii]
MIYDSNGVTFDEAKTRCSGIDAHLAKIRSKEQQDEIEDVLVSSGYGVHGIWFGLNDIAVEGTWVFTDGEPIGYSNWYLNYPQQDKVCLLSQTAGDQVLPQSDSLMNMAGSTTKARLSQSSISEVLEALVSTS